MLLELLLLGTPQFQNIDLHTEWAKPKSTQSQTINEPKDNLDTKIESTYQNMLIEVGSSENISPLKKVNTPILAYGIEYQTLLKQNNESSFGISKQEIKELSKKGLFFVARPEKIGTKMPINLYILPNAKEIKKEDLQFTMHYDLLLSKYISQGVDKKMSIPIQSVYMILAAYEKSIDFIYANNLEVSHDILKDHQDKFFFQFNKGIDLLNNRNTIGKNMTLYERAKLTTKMGELKEKYKLKLNRKLPKNSI